MGLGKRNASARHERGIAIEAARSEDYWLFHPGEHVMTCDGFPGVVASVEDGPHAGNEHYVVTLDNGMGGGAYSPSDLRSMPNATASVEHTAMDDYPELGSVLIDHPDPALEVVTASVKFGKATCPECGYFRGDAYQGSDQCPMCHTTLLRDEVQGDTPHESTDCPTCGFYSGSGHTGADGTCPSCHGTLEHHVASYDTENLGDSSDLDNSGIQNETEPEYFDDFVHPKQASYEEEDPSCSVCGGDHDESEHNDTDNFCPADGNHKSECEWAGHDATEKGVIDYHNRGWHDHCNPHGCTPANDRVMAHAAGDHSHCKSYNCPETENQYWDEDSTTPHDWNSHGPEFHDHHELNTDTADMGGRNYNEPDPFSAHTTQRTLDNIDKVLGLRFARRVFLDHNTTGPSHYSMLVEAADDPDFRFHVTASWADVQKKAVRLRKEGRVRIVVASSAVISAEVKGDHHIYETQLQYAPASHKVAIWTCGCKWGAYSWGRSGRWKRFEGRMCSHALATSYEAQSRGMFGKEVTPDPKRPSWMRAHSPIVIEFDKDDDKNVTRRAVPPGNMRRSYGGLWSGPHTEHIENYGLIPHWKPEHPPTDEDASPDAGEVHILSADRSSNKKHQVMVIDHHGNSQWPIRYDNGDLGWDHPESIVTPHHIVHDAIDRAQRMDGNGSTDEHAAEMADHIHEHGWDQANDLLKDNPTGPSHYSALTTLIREALSQGDDPAEIVLAITAAGIDSPQMRFQAAVTAGQMMDEEDPGGGNGAGPDSGEDEEEQMGDGTGMGIGGLGNAATGSLHVTAEWNYTPHPEPMTHPIGRVPYRPLQAGDHVIGNDGVTHHKIIADAPSLLQFENIPSIQHRRPIEGDDSGSIMGITHEDAEDMNVGSPEEQDFLKSNPIGPSKYSSFDEAMFEPDLPHQGAFLAAVPELLEAGAGAGEAAEGAESGGGISDLIKDHMSGGGGGGNQDSHDTEPADVGGQTGVNSIGEDGQIHFGTWTPVPEGALPETDGEAGGPPTNGGGAGNLEGDQGAGVVDPETTDVSPVQGEGAVAASLHSNSWSVDVAMQAKAYLAKTSMKEFSLAEQNQIINEGGNVRASNLDRLEITGTHYEALEAALASNEEDDVWF